MNTTMTAVIYAAIQNNLVVPKNTPRRSLAAAAPLTDKDIKKAQWRKHIEEISRHLATEPIQSEELTFEQKE